MHGVSKVCAGLLWEGSDQENCPARIMGVGLQKRAGMGHTINKLGVECLGCAGSPKCPCTEAGEQGRVRAMVSFLVLAEDSRRLPTPSAQALRLANKSSCIS